MSAFFSGSEVALFSLDKKQLNKIEAQNSLLNRYIILLLKSPRRLLVTILLGNTIFNVAATIIAVSLAVEVSKVYNYSVELVLLIQIIALTIFILIIGEITPKLFASKAPVTFSRIVAFPLYWTSVIIYPVAKILTDSIKFLVSKIKIDSSKTALRRSEITELADIGMEHGSIEEDEHELIHGLVDFKSISTREVMTPRVDIKSISVESSFEKVIKIITDSGNSRIPIYKDSLDNIVGILYAKDVLNFLVIGKAKHNFNLKKILREAMFVPETKLISELLKEFQKKNMHIGIVVDEYGGTAGLISLEDILEEIVGEIQDEYDNEDDEIIKINDDKYILLGKVDIDEVNELLDSDFKNEDDDYDTVGGFIFQQAGNIPEKGYSFDYNNFNFEVIEIDNNRISKVIVKKIKRKEAK
ncbi:MAG: hemolysin family protein [Melioribacteraceae bacterium]|nr:hemolysin family protein [Melioribacteraceae bacterium]